MRRSSQQHGPIACSFLDLYRRSGDKDYTFSDADYLSYKEQEEFTVLVAAAGKYDSVATAIRSVQP